MQFRRVAIAFLNVVAQNSGWGGTNALENSSPFRRM